MNQELEDLRKRRNEARKSGNIELWKSLSVECRRFDKKMWNRKNKERYLKKNKERYQRNIEERRREGRERYKNNKEAFYQTHKRWRLKNKDRANEFNREWKKQNKGKVLAYIKLRKLEKIKRTPPWLSKEDIKQITLLYKEASRLTSETGVSHHVDHIIPLRGKMVSGLHVPSNLQILRADENMSKGNTFTPGQLAQN